MVRVPDTGEPIPPEGPLPIALDVRQGFAPGLGVLHILVVAAAEFNTPMAHELFGRFIPFMVHQGMAFQKFW